MQKTIQKVNRISKDRELQKLHLDENIHNLCSRERHEKE